MSFQTEPLVEVIRGGHVESEHRGALAVVDATGRAVAHVGDVNLVSYLRSSAKPFQLLPLIESGAADRFGFTGAELAVMAGSHSGEPRHVAAVQSILDKIGLSEDALRCGVHMPFDPKAAHALRAAGREPTPIYNNCSGKHAGMLAQAVDRGLSTHDYLDPHHPVQITIRQRLADLAGMSFDEISVGVDGCSAPTFALPLKASALAFARLTPQPPLPATNSAPPEEGEHKRTALNRVAQVMMDHPEMVAGEGRLDTDLMRAANGRIVSKGGAEGYHGMGLVSEGQPALGVAIKIADGDGRRGGHPVVIEVLRQLGVLDDEALAALKSYHMWATTNHRGWEVGEVKAKFELIRNVEATSAFQAQE